MPITGVFVRMPIEQHFLLCLSELAGSSKAGEEKSLLLGKPGVVVCSRMVLMSLAEHAIQKVKPATIAGKPHVLYDAASA